MSLDEIQKSQFELKKSKMEPYPPVGNKYTLNIMNDYGLNST